MLKGQLRTALAHTALSALDEESARAADAYDVGTNEDKEEPEVK